MFLSSFHLKNSSSKVYNPVHINLIQKHSGVFASSWKLLFFKSGKPILGQIFGNKRAKIDARNTKIDRGHETYPIRVNARYEMNWANSLFSKSSGKPVYWWTGRWMDEQTSGCIQHTPITVRRLFIVTAVTVNIRWRWRNQVRKTCRYFHV